MNIPISASNKNNEENSKIEKFDFTETQNLTEEDIFSTIKSDSSNEIKEEKKEDNIYNETELNKKLNTISDIVETKATTEKLISSVSDLEEILSKEELADEQKDTVMYNLTRFKSELEYRESTSSVISVDTGAPKATKQKKQSSDEDEEYFDSGDALSGTTVLADILSGVNEGFDYDFKEAGDEELSDGSQVGFKGTIINKSHEKTSLHKSGAVGVRAETANSKALRESYIVGTRENGAPMYNFNEGGRLIDMEDEIEKGRLVIKKETKHMGTLYFEECTKEEARDMVICGHYSHKFQGTFGKVNVGVWKEGRLLGVASFGLLMNPESYKSFGDFKKGEVIELNRLWVDDELGMNTETMILSASWTIMRNNYPEIMIVQSFADGRLGAGTIYKASNFKYYGVETTLFFRNKETGVISHKVGMENTKATTSFVRLNKMYLEGKLQQFKVNTYRYIFQLHNYRNVPILDENGNEQVNEFGRTLTKKVPLKITFEELPFPKYQRGQDMLEDYEHNSGLIARAYILARLNKIKDTDGKDCSMFFEWDCCRRGTRGVCYKDTFEEFLDMYEKETVQQREERRKKYCKQLWNDVMFAINFNGTLSDTKLKDKQASMEQLKLDAESDTESNSTSTQRADEYTRVIKEFKAESSVVKIKENKNAFDFDED